MGIESSHCTCADNRFHHSALGAGTHAPSGNPPQTRRLEIGQQLDLIVRGTEDEVSAIAARHGVRIKKRLTEGAVLQANGAQIEAISNDTPRVARDVEVRSFMSISNAAIGADQVRAGLAGMGPFTGAGIGIALIDSGVWTGHRSLAGRVVFAKDFVGDGKGTLRGQGPRIR